MIYLKTKKTHSTNHNHLYHQPQPQPPLQPVLSRGKKKTQISNLFPQSQPQPQLPPPVHNRKKKKKKKNKQTNKQTLINGKTHDEEGSGDFDDETQSLDQRSTMKPSDGLGLGSASRSEAISG